MKVLSPRTLRFWVLFFQPQNLKSQSTQRTAAEYAEIKKSEEAGNSFFQDGDPICNTRGLGFLIQKLEGFFHRLM
jgi:hypothetical protein